MQAELRALAGSADAMADRRRNGRIWMAAKLVMALALLCGVGSTALGWDRAHSVGSNTGLALVTTAPAKKAPITVPGLGTFAPGAGPVAAPDGTIYMGTQQGKVIALREDGSPYWTRDLPAGHAVTAPPVVTSDGSVYVIDTITYRDHRVTPAIKVSKSMLNIFTSSGGWRGSFPFPEHDGPGVALGPLNILRVGGREVLIVTAVYKPLNYSGFDVRLVAFEGAQVVADQLVTRLPSQDVTGSGISIFDVLKCLALLPCLGIEFPHGVIQVPEPPAPQVAIDPRGSGTVVVSDNIKDVVGYAFSGNSFTEVWRAHDNDYFMRSTPTILPDGHTLIGVEKIERKDGQEYLSAEGAVFFTGPDVSPLPHLNTGRVYAAPSVTADGRTVLVAGEGNLLVLRGAHIEANISIPRGSIASAAASSNHLFVSTPDAFITYDVNTLAEVARINWVGGGLSSPIIGPHGYVYAIASNILFVFPPAGRAPVGGGLVGQPLHDVVLVDPGQPPVQPASQLFHPPLTPNGNHLFACLELDQDDCGKGDYKDISAAWCQKQGYSKVKGYDVDSRKVKAETLDGKFCSKSKCKVFDSIACEM